MTAKNQLGITAQIKSFSFVNVKGGTGMSNWNHNPRFAKPLATVRLLKAWHDYEVGYRFIGMSADESVKDYLDVVAGGDKRIFFSEHHIVYPVQEKRLTLPGGFGLFQQFCEAVGTVTTTDGYKFRKNEIGEWTDDDMTFKSTLAMLESVDVVAEDASSFAHDDAPVASTPQTTGASVKTCCKCGNENSADVRNCTVCLSSTWATGANNA